MRHGGLLLGLFASVACQSDLEVARLNQAVDGALPPQPIPSAPDAEAPVAEAGACAPRDCRGRPAACGNCLDDDMDGLTDRDDPDCWGDCDDSEVTWGHAMMCSNESCYFDRDCGFGNDETCTPLIPNGCDCHGCCQVAYRPTPLSLGTFSEQGAPTCSASVATDVVACASCELDAACFNPCDSDENCFGER